MGPLRVVQAVSRQRCGVRVAVHHDLTYPTVNTAAFPSPSGRDVSGWTTRKRLESRSCGGIHVQWCAVHSSRSRQPPCRSCQFRAAVESTGLATVSTYSPTSSSARGRRTPTGSCASPSVSPCDEAGMDRGLVVPCPPLRWGSTSPRLLVLVSSWLEWETGVITGRRVGTAGSTAALPLPVKASKSATHTTTTTQNAATVPRISGFQRQLSDILHVHSPLVH